MAASSLSSAVAASNSLFLNDSQSLVLYSGLKLFSHSSSATFTPASKSATSSLSTVRIVSQATPSMSGLPDNFTVNISVNLTLTPSGVIANVAQPASAPSKVTPIALPSESTPSNGSAAASPVSPAAIEVDDYSFVAPSSLAASIVPRAKQAAPAALFTMAHSFPTAMQEEAFIKAVAGELFRLGFTRDNNIALVNTCRDEVCRPLINLIDREFGLSFNISGLGGLLNCGKTGFRAAMSHSPEFKCDKSGVLKERYIFFAFPHVSVGESGEVGSLLRRGRGKPSSACGALIAIRGDISAGSNISEDNEDKEYVLLKQKVMAKLNTSAPDLVEVTNAALKAITEDLENLITQVVDPSTADYAVITGVQIHSGNQVPGEPFRLERTCDYIAPDTAYAIINGQRLQLNIPQSANMLVRP